MAELQIDPCQMAVILNTGSQDMKNAVNQLNTPLSQASDIPTQVDTRADADTVIKTMDQAKQEASQSLVFLNHHLQIQEKLINL